MASANATPKKTRKRTKKAAPAPAYRCRFWAPRGSLILRYTPNRGS